MSNGKDLVIPLKVKLTKKTLCKGSQYFSKPYKSFGGNISVKVDLSDYATESDLKNVTWIATYNFALKSNLASLKSEVDKLDIEKFIPVPADLSKQNVVVKNSVVKKLSMIN